MNKLSVSRSFLSLLLGCCLLAFSAAAQTTVKVSGVVKDRLDKAMSGVSVTVQGNAKLGTQTNDKGEFSITVSTTDALVFSYVGYQSVTRPVSNTIYFEVVLDAAQGRP